VYTPKINAASAKEITFMIAVKMEPKKSKLIFFVIVSVKVSTVVDSCYLFHFIDYPLSDYLRIQLAECISNMLERK